MKDSGGKGVSEKWLFWVIDPIASFIDGGEGEKNHALVIPGRTPRILNEPVLWKLGKRAFDTLASKLDCEITRTVIDAVFYDTLGALVKLWNGHAEILEQRIEGGHIPMINSESEEFVTDQTSICVDQTDPWIALGHRIEPFIRMLDNIIEVVNLEQGLNNWPYDREFIAAYFTLCHIDNSAVQRAINEAYKDDYELTSYWFNKVDSYRRTKDAIDQHNRFSKSEQSTAANKVRHARGKEARNLVIEHWSQNKNDFPSAEKAGHYYADWLEAKDFKYEPRTITDWIRKHAKNNGIRLR